MSCYGAALNRITKIFSGCYSAVAETTATQAVLQSTAAARAVLMRCRLRLRGTKGMGTSHGSRLRSRAGGSWGGRWACGLPERLVPRHIVQNFSHSLRRVGTARRPLPPSPAPKVVFVVPPHAGRGRRPLRFVPYLVAASIRAQLLHSAPARARTLRRGCGVRRRSSAFGECFWGEPHPRLRFPGSFGWLSKVRKLHLQSTLQTIDRARRQEEDPHFSLASL